MKIEKFFFAFVFVINVDVFDEVCCVFFEEFLNCVFDVCLFYGFFKFILKYMVEFLYVVLYEGIVRVLFKRLR